jgi:hypothetical protein
MKIYLLIAAIFTLFILNSAYAQEQQAIVINEEQITRNITVSDFFGAAASSVSGVGLSYMHYFTPYYHFKITIMPPYMYRVEKTNESNEKAFNRTVFFNDGLELRRNLSIIYKRNAIIQLYTSAGGSYWYWQKKRPFTPEDNEFRRLYTAGLGLGAGFIFANKISLNVDLYYQYSHWIDYGKRYAGIGGGISTYAAF